MSCLRAWLFDSFGGPERLRLGEVEEPRPARGSVVVRVEYAGVNPVDRSMVSGRFSWISLPHTPGAEFVGTVEELGDQVSEIGVGDRVAVMPNIFCGKCYYCLRGDESSCLENPHIYTEPYLLATHRGGGWAERVVVPAQNLVKLPENLGFREASTLPVDGMTAWHLVRRTRPQPGELAVVVGAAGGIGSFATQFLRLHGCSVVAVVGTEKQAQAAMELGADYVVSKNEDLAGFVRKIGTRGADIVVDPLGSSTWKTSVASLAPMGRYATCGVLTGTVAEIDLLRLYSAQIEVIGSTLGSRWDLRRVVELVSAGKVKPLVDSVFGFEQAKEALVRLGEHGRTGKVLLRIAGR